MIRSQDITVFSGALLYPENLTDRFFDVSSTQAGEVLQKLRTYGVHLAVVWAPDIVQFSSRFADLLAAERRDRFFDIFDTRAAAREWLARAASFDPR